MEKLAQDTILNIISSLPHQSIINCKLVCKRWRDLLSDTQLGLLFLVGTQRNIRTDLQLYHGGQQYNDIDMHGRRYSYKTLVSFGNHPTTSPADSWYDMVGSCNGLVCFAVAHDLMCDPTYICNPVTGEFVNLPEYVLVEEDYLGSEYRVGGDLINGFGYNYSTDEYKVVRMYARSSYPLSEKSLKVQVYTIGSGLGWRDKGRVEFFISIQDASICANGALHWIEISKRKIVAFDLADEKFILVRLPSSVYKDFSVVTLKLLKGYLSVFHVQEGTGVDIWSLKKKKQCKGYDDMGEDEFENYWRWDKEFSIPWDGTKAKYYNVSHMSSYHPFAVTKSNQVLLWFNGVLSCYDAKTSTLIELWDDDSSRIWVEAFPHLNSLVSLEALGEKSTQRRGIACPAPA